MIFSKQLSEICDIRFGVAEQTAEIGEIAYIQINQFDDKGIKNDAIQGWLPNLNRIEAYLLMVGDVLLAAKGNKLFAWAYTDLEGKAVASTSFFILRPKQNVVNVKYLETYLNTPLAKSSFLQIGAGTNIFSIRKSELGAFQIPLPSLEQQKKIAALAELHQKEVQLAQQLIAQKQHLYAAIISKLIK